MLVLERIMTDCGEMTACALDEGICLLEFSSRAELAEELASLERHFQTTVTLGTHPYIDNLKTELKDYFSGKLRNFTVPAALFGTPFQLKIWKELLSIPYGTTLSYSELAIRTGNKLSVRAVATANKTNRIAIMIPCHRVIGSDGSLTGYSGGLERKRYLINLEANNSSGYTDRLF